MKHKWNENSHYRKWVRERDRALERLHTRAQLEAADVMRELLTAILMQAKNQFHAIKHGHTIDYFEHALRHNFAKCSDQLYKIMGDLRVRAYTLACASESEIISRLVKSRQIHSTVSYHRLNEIRHKDSILGGDIARRVSFYLDRLRRKITTYAQAAAFSAKDVDEFARDVRSAFPRARRVQVPRRQLKPLKEADHNIKTDDDGTAHVVIDNIDQAAWDDMVDAYKNEYVPKTRSPEFTVGLPATSEEDTWYAWEFERDMSSEFVSAVRSGQVDAANENGITDFVIVSIIDDKTCEDCCGNYGCVDFDGLLASEVESMTKGGQDVPPYHFNCRCTLAPATENIPDVPDDGKEEFDDWLNS